MTKNVQKITNLPTRLRFERGMLVYNRTTLHSRVCCVQFLPVQQTHIENELRMRRRTKTANISSFSQRSLTHFFSGRERHHIFRGGGELPSPSTLGEKYCFSSHRESAAVMTSYGQSWPSASFDFSRCCTTGTQFIPCTLGVAKNIR